MKKGKHTVLFICLGNICRSPAAEGIMKSIVKDHKSEADFEIDSAGIGNWHIGQLPDSRMRECGRKHGYTLIAMPVNSPQLTSNALTTSW